MYNSGMTARLLAVSIGNSRISIGVFENETLSARWRARTDTNKTADEYALLLDDFFRTDGFEPDGWRGAALVSVVPALKTTFQELCLKHYRLEPLIVTSGVKTGMAIRYDNPRALGADRLVESVAAKARYGAPVIVIDFGTATTFNAVNRAGEFVGGAIAPGLNLAADALYRATAQLPRVDLALPPRVIATNTVHAIQAGIVFGYLAMVEGMATRMRDELGEPYARVVATGGRATLVAPRARVIETIDADLILHGLRVIYEMNV